MASGMGIPSIGIYSYELYTVFGVENIIRVGSAGAVSEKCHLRDIVAGIGACTNSNFGSQYGLDGIIAPVCSYEMLVAADKSAAELGLELKVGSLYSSDTFYDDTRASIDWAKMGCLAVEMEAAGLYLTAMRTGKKALAICTISDLCYEPFDALDAEAMVGFVLLEGSGVGVGGRLGSELCGRTVGRGYMDIYSGWLGR